MKRAAPLFLFLTLLVWGLFAFDRGLFHDDASNLAWAQAKAARAPWGLLEPLVAPTRLLLGAPYVLAWHSQAPALVLELALGCGWLLSGFAVLHLAARLFPGSPGVALASGALALTASSDLLTGSSLGVGYVLSGLSFTAALAAALRFQETARGSALAAAAVLLNVGLLFSDGVTAAAPLAPLVFVAARGRWDRRVAVASGAWLLSALPYGVAYLLFLRAPGSYAAVALAPFDAVRQTRLTAALTFHDFAPWRWAFRRPTWIEDLPAILPAWLYVAAALAAAAAFVAAAARAGDATAAADRAEDRRRLGIAAALLLLVVATHAAYSGVQLAEVRFRTHLVTRLPASILVALAAAAAARRLRAPRLGLALTTSFVALGVAGAVERQDTFLANWRRHRAELSSIVEAVPALSPGATLVLSLAPDPGGFQATRVPYLAEAWLSILHDGARPAPRVVVWLPGWGRSCREGGAGLECRDAAGAPPADTIPWDRLVLLSFDAAASRYRLVPSVAASGGAYRPQVLVEPSRPSPRALSLLAGPRFLARLLPGANSADAMLAPP